MIDNFIAVIQNFDNQSEYCLNNFSPLIIILLANIEINYLVFSLFDSNKIVKKLSFSFQ